MPLLFRTAVMAGALALSSAAFAGNEEGNKPLNNVTVTAPPMYVPEGRAAAESEVPQTHVAHHYRHHAVSGNTSGMGNSQSTNPQSNY
jgi:hypothetical protein